MRNKKFQRKIENFICEHCGRKTKGNGYTDHCPYCLYSKHVDINPGDRQAVCGGLMKPVGVGFKNGKYIIYYRCLKCGFKHRVRASAADNIEKLVEIAGNPFDY